jgi:hypothetical protein
MDGSHTFLAKGGKNLGSIGKHSKLLVWERGSSVVRIQGAFVAHLSPLGGSVSLDRPKEYLAIAAVCSALVFGLELLSTVHFSVECVQSV